MNVVPLAELGPADFDQWRSLRAADPSLASPYFDPAFALAVNERAQQVLVAIDTRPHGSCFLPIERHGDVALPAGYPASDYHGPIATPGTVLHGQALLRAAKVSRFLYTHLTGGSGADADWPVEMQDTTFHVALGGGLTGYGSRHRDGHVPDHIKKAQKVGRKVPDLNFEFDCRDPRMLDLMIDWKRRQYMSTGAVDNFSDPRSRRVVHACFNSREPGCTGVLSVLRSGDKPLAVHFGLRAGGLLHSWHPAYDPEASRHSPGVLLTIKIIEMADELGLTKFDLGAGPTEYKRRLHTGTGTVGMGEIDRYRWRGGVRRGYRNAWRSLRKTEFYDQLRRIKARAKAATG